MKKNKKREGSTWKMSTSQKKNEKQWIEENGPFWKAIPPKLIAKTSIFYSWFFEFATILALREFVTCLVYKRKILVLREFVTCLVYKREKKKLKNPGPKK